MKKSLFAFSAVCLMMACNESNKEEQPKAEIGPDPGSAVSIVDEARKAIDEQNKSYGDGFAKMDSSLFLDHYTEDACIMPGGAPKLCGREGLLGFFHAGTQKMGVRNIAVTTDEVFGTEEAMVEVGQYQLYSDSAKTKPTEKGKFIVVWKKVDGKWKMHRDIFNPSPEDAPPAPAAAK
ncbi:MAG: nuclear transport factor 2 family protein [Ferruginibacter sp.]|jgi:ketosteroid isomerase-like protein